MKNSPCLRLSSLLLSLCEAVLRTSQASCKLGTFTGGKISRACPRQWIGICVNW